MDNTTESAYTGDTDSQPMTLMVCKSFTGQVYRVVLDAKMTMVQAVAFIADKIDYYSPDYERIGLYNLTRDFEYSPGDVLGQSGTQSGDLVIMADGASAHKDD